MTDLFGNPDTPTKRSAPRLGQPVQDHELLLSVIDTAARDGYRLVGVRERVYRVTGTQDRRELVEPVPRYEETAVRQLIQERHLQLGGQHPCRYGRHDGAGRAIVVPKRTRQLAGRWRGYTGHHTQDTAEQGPSPPGGPGPGRPVGRILVTGSRSWTQLGRLRTVLAHWYQQHPTAVLVHGDARGVDRLAASLWAQWGGRTEAHPADWPTHGRRAGPVRNQHMVTQGADLCLAFVRDGSTGASHTAALAEAAGIHTIRTETRTE